MINKVANCFCMAFRTSSKWSTAYHATQFRHRFGFILRPGTTESRSKWSLHLSGCRSHRMELPAITSVSVEDKLQATVLLDSDGCPKWLTEGKLLFNDDHKLFFNSWKKEPECCCGAFLQKKALFVIIFLFFEPGATDLLLTPCLESLPRLMALTTKCRQAQWSVRFLEMRQGLRVSGSTYIVGIRYNFPGVHSTPKSLPVTQLHPRFSTRLVHCGKSSLELFSTLQLDDLSSPIFDHLLKFVYLGKKVKEPLPDWFHKKYGCGLDEKPGTHFKGLNESDVKCERHTKNFTVLPSHIDFFGHTNHFVYIKFIIDTISDFLCHNKNESGLFHLPLSSMEIFYAGDCFEGDVLKVTLLECSSDKKDFLGVRISKERDNSVIVHFKATFKGDMISSKNQSKL